MATYGFFPIRLSVIVSLFDATFDDAFFIPETKCTHLILYGWGDPPEFHMVQIAAFAFNCFNAFFGKVWLDQFEHLIDAVQFVVFQWGAGIAVLAATSFAFM